MKRTIKKLCGIFSAILIAAGCATRVDMGELPADHPASPQAEAAQSLEPTALLNRSLPLSGSSPVDEAKQHDHMQQMEPGPHDAQERQQDHAKSKPESQYACPKHPEMTSPYVGNCMRCNHPLERQITHHESSPKPDAAQEDPASPYLCTMHPSLPLNSSGLCPVCGMTLIERKTKE
jgi:hypothetical protein